MATITYTVTVATGTTQYGTGNRYYINGELAPVLYLQEGNTYIFDQSDTTNATHTIAFSTNANNSPAAPYTTGVTTTGVPRNAGANTTIKVAQVRTTGAPLLFYYCTAHAGMGNTAQTISPTSETTEFNPQIDDVIQAWFPNEEWHASWTHRDLVVLSRFSIIDDASIISSNRTMAALLNTENELGKNLLVFNSS